MSKQWLALVGLGIFLVILMVGWELFLIFTGQKAEFSYTTPAVNSFLYEDIEQHFVLDPKYSSYQEQATGISSVEEFE